MYTKNMTKVYKATDIAKYIIYLASQVIIGDNNEREGITNLKLQKILYLAQGYFLAKKKRPLFNDDIEAWQYGPVVPSVYKVYKGSNESRILLESDVKIDHEDMVSIKEVWETFGKYSAGTLVDFTHKQSPWINSSASTKKVISQESMKDFFKGVYK